MIDSKEAAKIARAYFEELFPDKKKGLELEEVELQEDGHSWSVLFSFPRPDLNFLGAPLSNPARSYKAVFVDADRGEVRGVKIRLLHEA